jgi:hypothetical protein
MIQERVSQVRGIQERVNQERMNLGGVIQGRVN